MKSKSLSVIDALWILNPHAELAVWVEPLKTDEENGPTSLFRDQSQHLPLPKMYFKHSPVDLCRSYGAVIKS